MKQKNSSISSSHRTALLRKHFNITCANAMCFKVPAQVSLTEDLHDRTGVLWLSFDIFSSVSASLQSVGCVRAGDPAGGGMHDLPHRRPDRGV